MGRRSRTALAVIVFLILPAPAWLYASGNFPLFFPMPETVVFSVKESWPVYAAATFVEARWIFEKLRSKGIHIPLTYNERLLRIAQMKIRTRNLCDEIIIGN